MTAHQSAIDLWCVAYERQFGRKYVFTPADARAVKQLLAGGYTPELIQSTALQTWAVAANHPNLRTVWNCQTQSASLVRFAARINEIVAEIEKMKPKQSAKGAF